MTSKITEMNETQRNEVFLQSQTVRERTFREWLEGKDIEAPDANLAGNEKNVSRSWYYPKDILGTMNGTNGVPESRTEETYEQFYSWADTLPERMLAKMRKQHRPPSEAPSFRRRNKPDR